MHDGSIKRADDWLFAHLRSYALWAVKHNSLLIVTWDEGSSDDHIPTIFYGAGVRHGIDAERMNHYKLLRTIEDMYGLAPLAHAAENGPVLHAFTTQSALGSAAQSASVASLLVAARGVMGAVSSLFSQTPVGRDSDALSQLGL
jgi:hypothetical protein